MAGYTNYPPTSGSTWYSQQQAFLASAIPQLTAFENVKYGDTATGNVTFPATIVDGATEGGSLSINGAGAFVKLQTDTAYQNMQTGRFGWAFRMKCSAITAGQFSLFGWSNGSTKWILVGTDQSISATNFVVEMTGAAATNVATSLAGDANWHTVAGTYDLTTLNIYFDGANVLSTSSVANLPNAACSISAFSSSGTGVVRINRAIYGYVDP